MVTHVSVTALFDDAFFHPRMGQYIYNNFSDSVILADIGTSFAKVLGDVWLAVWMLKPGNSMLNPPVDDSWLRWILPTVMRYVMPISPCSHT